MLRELEDREIWGEDPETYTEWSDLLSMAGWDRQATNSNVWRAGRASAASESQSPSSGVKSRAGVLRARQRDGVNIPRLTGRASN